MSKPKYDWWYPALQIIRNYPLWKKQLNELHSQSVTAGEGGIPSGGEVSRKTENIALRQLPPRKQEELDAVEKAIEITKMMPNGDLRVEMIRRIYWQGKKLRINDVVYGIGISGTTGGRWHRDFVELVGVFAKYEV